MITSKAAVLFAPGADLEIVDVTVAPPREGEVLVEIASSGLCHTDTTTFTGDNPSCVYPAVLGHEGAGIVREVGPGVTGLAVEDRVIPLYGPHCGRCRMCASGRTNLCWSIKATRDRGVMPDGTSRFSLPDGAPIHHFMGTSTFSNYTVVPEIALARIREDAPLDTVCLLGCGVTTGVGAALNDVRPDDTVAVFGLGGIGINVVQGARLAGAAQIVGIDPVTTKRDLATQLGMTDFINPADCDDVVAALKDLAGGGVDVAFECTGIVTVMRQSIDCLHPGWGTSVLMGVEPAGAEVSFPPVLARYGRTVKGSYFGGVNGRYGLNWYVDLYLDGDLAIDPLITHRLPVEEINKGFELMARGEGVRTVVSF
jgi:S-(hydroxymethyl)glutathione dehydrogenase/alcohol dehydrogenase